DALETCAERRWLVLRDRCSQAVQVQELPAGADLRGAMAAERAGRQESGWNVDDSHILRTDARGRLCAEEYRARLFLPFCLWARCWRMRGECRLLPVDSPGHESSFPSRACSNLCSN